MLKRVTDYVNENNLISEGDKIVVGVSGGADSVCLLHILVEISRQISIELVVTHVHHGIRGEAADRDEAFVRDLTERLGLKFYSYHYDIPRIAREEGMSEEEAGRELRYRTFLEICSTHGCNKIAIAHNRNDNAETILFHLFRGSSLRGLSGIPSQREAVWEAGTTTITIIRPILFALREEIEAYLSQNKFEYRNDASNFMEYYSRNKLRHQVLPYVAREINAEAVTHITEAAEELREASDFIGRQVAARFEELVRFQSMDGASYYEFDSIAMSQEDIVIQKGILMKILEGLTGSRKDMSRTHVLKLLELLEKQVGKQISLPNNIRAKRSYHTVRVLRQSEEWKQKEDTLKQLEPVKLKIPGRVLVASVRKVVETKIRPAEKGLTFPKNSCTKWFDYDKIENALELRTRKEGDYLQINGQGGTKRLKDYFIDRKLPKDQRDSILLIADGSHIMWILGDGERMSEKYKITEETGRLLSISINDAEEKEDGR